MDMENQRLMVILSYWIIAIFAHRTTPTRLDIPGYFKWSNEGVASQFLYCPNCCITNITKDSCRGQFFTGPIIICCTKESKPFWEFDLYENLTQLLGLNFTDSYDHGTIINISDKRVDYNVLESDSGNMSCLPENICAFPNLIVIKLVYHKLEKIADLSCLKILDTLDLSNNRIKNLPASTFSGLSYLRCLRLSYNQITYIDPGVFKYTPKSLTRIYLNGNRLTSVDVTILHSIHFFDKFDLSWNSISSVTNKLNSTGFLPNQPIGGGTVNLNYNNFTTAPTLSELGFMDIKSALRGTFNYIFHIEENPLNCDCRCFTFIKHAAHASINFDGLSFQCQNPPQLKNYVAKKFRENQNSFDLLVCNISISEKCPPKCQCFKQPSKQRVVVNCTLTNRTSMLKAVPDEDNLDIDLSHNLISNVEYLDYLNRTTAIDLSFNNIVSVDSRVFTLKNINSMILHHNKITDLKRSIQQMDPCKLKLGNVMLGKCSCAMQWIPTWLEQLEVRHCLPLQNVVICHKENQQLNLSLLHKTDLCPTEESSQNFVWLLLTVLIGFVLSILFCNFRHEIYVYSRKRNYFPRKTEERSTHYDIYLSFNAENNDIRLWSNTVLCKYLENQGFEICFPPRDFIVGRNHVDQINWSISCSRSFIVILSQDYQKSQLQNVEWSQIWSTFISDYASNIIVINYDLMSCKDVTHRKLKAYMRLGYALDFSDIDNCLLKKIMKNLHGSRKQK